MRGLLAATPRPARPRRTRVGVRVPHSTPSPTALTEVEPDELRDTLRQPPHVLHLVPPRKLQPPHGVPARPQVLQERAVARRGPAQPPALARLERAAPRGGGRAREERTGELAARLELAQAREAVRGELERCQRPRPAPTSGRNPGAERDVEVEDLERGVREEEGCGCVEARVWGAPEVGEREGAEGGPAAAEEEIVCDGAEEPWRVARDVADVQSLGEARLIRMTVQRFKAEGR